jgi:hypothetical protein
VRLGAQAFVSCVHVTESRIDWNVIRFSNVHRDGAESRFTRFMQIVIAVLPRAEAPTIRPRRESRSPRRRGAPPPRSPPFCVGAHALVCRGALALGKEWTHRPRELVRPPSASQSCAAEGPPALVSGWPGGLTKCSDDRGPIVLAQPARRVACPEAIKQNDRRP